MTAQVRGIASLEVPVSWELDSIMNEAGELQGENINTVVREEGWRIWGAKMGVADESTSLRRFFNVFRIAADVKRELQRVAFPYYGLNITQRLLDKVSAAGTAYLSVLAENEQLQPGGKIVAPASKNPPASLAAGDLTFVLDYTPVFPAQRINTEIQLRTRNL